MTPNAASWAAWDQIMADIYDAAGAGAEADETACVAVCRRLGSDISLFPWVEKSLPPRLLEEGY